MNRSLPIRHALLAAALTAVLTSPALAGGPLANCQSGVPFRWPGGGANIPFNPDQGDLGPVSHADAVLRTQQAFDVWGAVPTSSVSYTNGGELPVDVDFSNFGPWLEPTAPDGLSAIVFDHTGQIFNALFGPGSGVLGFAGPEWINGATCEILEGVSFLNGPSFTNATAAKDVMVHEFGHYTNLAHTAVNGQFLGFDDTTGPTPFESFAPRPVVASDVIETMYPFYFGVTSGTQTLEADDVAIVSTIYPALGFPLTHGTITGTIRAPNGVNKISGVNVIARNVADPFFDAVSAMSGDFTESTAQADPFTGVYRLNGLTPGATYQVFVDEILAGGFSTPPVTLPGPEEFYSVPETNNLTVPDPPNVATGVLVAAGVPRAGIDVIFNAFAPGDPLPVGDDGFVELFPPFPFKVCGQEFSSVFVNANGSLSFGAGSGDFSESIAEFLAGPPRIAGVWDDLNAAAGGEVTFEQTSNTFTVTWQDVPEFPASGANTFSITLRRSSNQAEIEYGDLSAQDGLAGLSCGGLVTSQFENEENLRTHGHRRTINMGGRTAAFEIFNPAATPADPNDLAHYELTFTNFKRGFDDAFEPNNTIATAERIQLPFHTPDVDDYTAIQPSGNDVDFFKFRVKAGDILAVEVVRGNIDSMIGIFDADTGDLLAFDDDGGCCGIGQLSRLLVQAPVDLNLAVGVTTWPDFDFTGDGSPGGRYVLNITKYRGTILPAGDDTSTAVPLGFTFRYQGQNWSTVSVNSNGSLTFGAGDTDFSESVPEFLAGPPRIAPLWDDLDAGDGLVIAEPGPLSMSLHYVSVPEFGSFSPNYFSVHLLPLGLFALDYGATVRNDAITGITQGAGAADPGETDLSHAFPILSGRGTKYEQFGSTEFDLSYRQFLFVPFF
jgi:hypothetical protein